METEKYLGPYRLGKLLGRGGMGSVYAAVHAKSGDHVAVKEIALAVSDQMRFRNRFAGEVETLKRLRHDNIVQLIGYGEEDGQLFYSMEMVEGETLQKIIRREKKIEWMRVIEISIQICAALKHAHDFGVYHRDLKPANLMLEPGNKVKLLDFGIAKTFGFGEQTAVGSVLGTADYMAPEQARNEGITQRTDLYALGGVMYTMLVGRPPFRGKSLTDVIESLKRDKPAPLDMIDPSLPEDLVELVHQLLEKAPEARPPTALAVMNRLKAMLAGLKKHATVNSFRGDTTDEASDPQVPREFANPTARTVHVPGAAPTDRTIADPAARPTQVPGEEASESKSTSETNIEKKTHFQTVDSSDSAGSGVFTSAQPESDDSVRQGVKIGLLALLLVAGLFVIVASLQQRESADDVYARITKLRDDGELSRSREDLDRFIKLYPEDERFDEVKGLRLSLDAEAIVRRLQIQRKLGVKELEAHEHGFLDAMELRNVDPQAASKKLESWSAVFVDDETIKSESIKKMSELSRFESRRLKQQGHSVAIDPRVQGVLDRIDAAMSLPQDEQQGVLRGIVEFYEDQDWAQSAVNRAKRMLTSTDP